MDTTEILEKAAALIEQGWTQGDYRKGTSYCMLGALIEASGQFCWGGLAHDVLSRLANVIDSSTSRLGLATTIITFNDNVSTSKEDVLLVFKKAIYEYES